VPAATEIMDADALDAALARTYARHGVLRRRQVTRRKWLAGGALAVALGAGATAIFSAGGSDQGSVRFGSPTSASAPTTVDPGVTIDPPPGYEVEVAGPSTVLQRKISTDGAPAVPPTLDVSSAVEERVAPTDAAPGPVPRSVEVRFACTTPGAQVARVAYEVVGGELRIDASVSYQPGGPPCGPSDVGPSITLPLAEPLPPEVQVVAGSVRFPLTREQSFSD